mgnify:CR=1 FL=1
MKDECVVYPFEVLILEKIENILGKDFMEKHYFEGEISAFITELYKEKILLMKDIIEQMEVINWFDRKFAESTNLSKISEKTQ